MFHARGRKALGERVSGARRAAGENAAADDAAGEARRCQGVARAWQGRGIGAALLAYALHVAVEGAESIASAVNEGDAKDDTARSLYARFGFRSLTDDRLHMFLSMETARQAIGKGRLPGVS